METLKKIGYVMLQILNVTLHVIGLILWVVFLLVLGAVAAVSLGGHSKGGGYGSGGGAS